MKVGDLVKRKVLLWTPTSSKFKDFNTLAIVVGFDCEGDIYLRYVNPAKEWETITDIDYKKSWELVNATD